MGYSLLKVNHGISRITPNTPKVILGQPSAQSDDVTTSGQARDEKPFWETQRCMSSASIANGAASNISGGMILSQSNVFPQIVDLYTGMLCTGN